MVRKARDKRVGTDLSVAYEEPGRQLFFPVVNLSTSGVYLSAKNPPDVGAEAKVIMSLPPDGVFVRLRGHVVRHADPVEPLGFALAFSPLDPQSDQELRRFIRRLC